ncbi:TLD protein [Toxoplasma gondii VAND]|uniref:Oxidation resistance protein 1 n=2 Tax=Toxoplasma gondii TaxID=5811 RepID=A0A086PYT4_TOXGO|nr:TLD protein [Toxoplasma gondii VAND]
MGDSSSKFSHATPALSYQRLSQQEVQELLSSFGLNEFSPAKARISLHSFLRIFPPVLHPTASVLLPVLRDVVRMQQVQGRGYSSSGFLTGKIDSSSQLAASKTPAPSTRGGLKNLGNLTCSGKGARKGEETCSGGIHITLQEMVDAVSACAYGDREELQVHMLQRLLSRMSKVLEEQCKRLRHQQSGNWSSRHNIDRGATAHSHHLGAGLFLLHHGGPSGSAGSLTSETPQTASTASLQAGASGAVQPSAGSAGVSAVPCSGIEAVLHQVFVSAYLLFLAIISPSNPIFSSANPFALAAGGPTPASPRAAGGVGDHAGAKGPAGDHASRVASSPRSHHRAGPGSPAGGPTDSDADFLGSGAHSSSRQAVAGPGMSGWDSNSSSAAAVSLPVSTPLDFSFLLSAFATSAGAAAGVGSKTAGPQMGNAGSVAAQGSAGAGGSAPPCIVTVSGAPGPAAAADKGASSGNLSGAQMGCAGASKQQQQDALLWILQVLPVLPTLFVGAVSHFLLGPTDPAVDDGAVKKQQPTLQYQVYAPRRRGTAVSGSSRRGSRARANSLQNLQRSPSLDTLCQSTGGWRGDGPLDGFSKIFTDETAVMLRLSSMIFAFPPLTPWHRLYSSWKQGASFNRICSSVFFYDAPTVLVIKTKHGPVLGAMISTEWKDGGHVYMGDANCFLFSLEPQFQIIRPSGLGRNFVYINVKNQFYPRGIGFGGQPGCFRLWLDDEFQNCYCTKSDATYGPGVLVASKRARVRHQGDSRSEDSLLSGAKRTQSLCSEDKGPGEGGGLPAGANGSLLSSPDGDRDDGGHEEQDVFHMPFEVLEVEVWGCGDASTRQQQLAANQRQEQLRQERRQVDKGRFAQNEFDREFLLENTFNRAKGADAPST